MKRSPSPIRNGSGVDDSNELLKRTKTPRACDVCRARKIKCTGGSPELPCATCKRSGIGCTFETRTVKRASPKGYVESLERRIESMESLIQCLTSGNNVSPGAEEVKSRSFQSPEGSAVEGLSNDLDNLELSVMDDRFVGRGSGLHLIRSVRAFAKNESGAPTSKPTTEEGATASLVETLILQDHLDRISTYPLPPTDLVLSLVNAFFDHVNTTFCLLHRAAFDRAIIQGLGDKDPDFRSLLFIVLAIGARFVDDPRIPLPTGITSEGSQQSRGWAYFRASYSSASPLVGSSSLYLLQASVLTLNWLNGSASPLSSYQYVGFAIRRAIDVGAHREHRTRWTNSPLEDQLRRRAFFALFAMDRIISAGLGRPLAIQDADTDLIEFRAISDEDLDLWNSNPAAGPPTPRPDAPPIAVSGAIALVRLARIMGTARSIFTARSPQDAASFVCGLDASLNEWLENVPAHLRWNPAKQDDRWLIQSALLYSSYLMVQIGIHREFISPSTAHLHSFPSLTICSNAARSTSHVLDLLRRRGKIRDAFMFAPMQAITSGLILLISVFAKGNSSSQLSSSALSDVKRCIDALGDLAKHTFIAGKCFGGLTKLSMIAIDPTAPFPANDNFCSAQDLKSAFATSKKRGIDLEEEEDSISPAASSLSSRSPTDSYGFDEEDSISATTTDTAGRHLSRTKSARHTAHRPSTGLPLTTSDLSHSTFRGYPTFASPTELFPSIPVASTSNLAPQFGNTVYNNPSSSSAPYSHPSTFGWTGPSTPSAVTTIDPLFHAPAVPPDYAPMSPGTEALFSGVNLFPSMSNATTGSPAFGFDYPFTFGSSEGDLQMNLGMGDWGTGFNFEAFSQTFGGAGA